MNLTEEQLVQIEELAGLFLNPEEIAVLMDLDAVVFMELVSLKSGPVYRAYFRGKTVSKKDIHANVVKMAKHGSPQAEELAREMIVQQNSAERRAKK
jgi:hypothetical protein